MKRLIGTVIVLAILAGGALGAVKWYKDRAEKPTSSFRTAQVKRGDLLVTISATGTLEPEQVVDVGAQVAGQIISFGNDANGEQVDYRSPVEAGQVLAKIDDSLYQADYKSTTAEIAAAKAGILRAQADLGQLQAKLVQAQRDWERAESLGPSEALAQTSYDSYKAAYEIAKANVAVGEASLEQARSAVTQAEAQLVRVQRNLDYCTIKSPVKGVIIDRRVNIGQTVVASLNAPSLFLIAQDLRQMQLWVPVNEADIGHVHEGQPVTFTVDAFPGENFTGKVSRVRLNAQMTQNVVTYTVEVTTDNSSGRLLPYLTANVLFETARRDDVPLVPNAALRWTPRDDQVLADATDAPDQAAPSNRSGRRGGGGPSTRSAGGDAAAPTAGTVWLQAGNGVRPLRVRLGLTDGAMTEVLSDNLTEGMQVVTGEQRSDVVEAPSGPASPFMPSFPARRGSAAREGGGGGGRRGG
jgi:HlyD family secretion protein